MPILPRHPIRTVALALSMLVAPASVAQDDDLVPLSKVSEDLVPLPALTPRMMEKACLQNGIDDPSRVHFTLKELGEAIRALTHERMGLLSANLDTAEIDAKTKAMVDRIENQRANLQTCQLFEYTRQLRRRAAASCEGLREATNHLDGPAVTALKRGTIVRGEWMEMLRMFMPAAQACRRKLGNCLNPDNEQQQRDYVSLLLFLVDVELVSNEETTTHFNLPPCDETMIRGKKDKQMSDDIITYVEGVVVVPSIVTYEEAAP